MAATAFRQTETQAIVLQSTYAVATQDAQSTAEAAQTAQVLAATNALATVQAGIKTATAIALPASEWAQTLVDEKLITSSDGYYKTLVDFDNTWSKKDRVQWWYAGQRAKNFALQADLTWDTSGGSTIWYSSGCGFVFEDNNAESQSRVILHLDGYARNYKVIKNSLSEANTGYFGPPRYSRRFRSPGACCR